MCDVLSIDLSRENIYIYILVFGVRVFDGVPLLLCCTAALQCMRRKAMFEKVLRQCTNELFRLGEQITKQKEASSRIAEVFQTMGSTNEASRARSRNTCMQEFDQVLDSIEFIQDEISETKH